MWIKPRARQRDGRWYVWDDEVEAGAETFDEAYELWALIRGIPDWLASPK